MDRLVFNVFYRREMTVTSIAELKNKSNIPEEFPLEIASIMVPKRVGFIIFFLVFGVFGIWATFAPLKGAAHAPGIVTVKSNKKLVQHLEGGIVSIILVQNGDLVRAGDPLLILDDTQAAAQLAIVRSQYIALKIREARLLAERDGLDTVAYPRELAQSDAFAREEIAAQNEIFKARRASNEGEKDVLEQRIGQLESRAEGLIALKASKEQLSRSYAEELEDIRALLNQGFSDKSKLRAIERNYEMMAGEASELVANISSIEVQIGETRLQIIQLDRAFRNEVVNELSDTQTRLKDADERMIALQDIVSRTVIRSPTDGVVTGMQVHTVGGVIPPANPIAEIVPQTEELIVEARIAVIDIDRVRVGQEATIRFSSFTSAVPTIFGKVIHISADTFNDRNTGAPFYQARIEVTPEGMAELGDLTLVPGMPAEAFIATGSRTFLQYAFKPFTNALARSLIED